MAAKKKGKAEKGKKGKEKADGAKAPCDGEEARARGSASPPPAQLSRAWRSAQMSEEQLKENIAHLRSELDHEREERNYFQLERDKINTFWEISKKELEDRKVLISTLLPIE